ncbi:MAG: GAF domain-containing protein, partial [Anaerolineales bacterium]
MSVALENARLFDETQRLLQETEARNAELQIINSIQQGLATELDFQAIIDLVGDKLRNIISADNFGIIMYDPENNLSTFPYAFYRGERVSIPARSVDGISGHIILNSGTTMVFNRNFAEEAKKYNSDMLVGNEFSKSGIYVPIKVGNKVIGVISAQDLNKEDAYPDSIVRLLEIITANMGTALENARLFDETQRLLQETEARNAELAVINSVQTGLASKLDMQAIYDLVGDKVSEITGSEIVVINTWDKKTKTSRYEYIREKGERFDIIERPFSPLAEAILPEMEQGKTVVWNEGVEERLKKFNHTLPAGEMPLSVIHIPIKTGDHFDTSISLQDTSKEHAFSKSTIRLVKTLAGSMGIALENARLFDETQRLLKETEARNAELAVINSVQEALAAELDMQGIYDSIGDKLREIFDVQTLGILTLVPDSDNMSIVYLFEKGKRYPVDLLPRTGLTNHIIETGEKVVINEDMAGFTEKYQMIKVTGGDAKSGVWMPYKIGSQVRGIISLQNLDRENAFPESDVRLLETIANSMSVALENARLFDETQRLLKETEERNAELAVINSVQTGLASNLDMRAIYTLVGDTIKEITDAGGVLIASWDWETRIMHTEYFRDGDQQFGVLERPLSALHDEVFPQIEKGKTVIFNEGIEEKYQELGHVVSAGKIPKTLIGIPLKIGGKTNSFISLQDTEKEFAFSASTIRLVETLANSMSVALENARLFDETTQRNAELAIVNSVSAETSRNLDVHTVVKIVGDKVQEIFDAEVVSIGLVNEEKGITELPYSYALGEYFNEESFPHGQGLAGIMFKTRQPLLLHTAEELAALGSVETEADQITKEKIQSWLGVPIIIGDELIGGVAVQSYKPHAFTESDLHLLTTLSNNMGAVIRNARLFEETKHLLKETEERNAELAVINSVQTGLAAELDFQGIINLVGDKLCEVLNTQDIGIRIYDPKTNMLHFPYEIEHGEMLNIPSSAPQHLSKMILETRKSIYGSNKYFAEQFGLPTLPGTDTSLALLAVPILMGENPRGLILVEDFHDENAYSESDVRLLETLANSLAVSLENARLFEELQNSYQDISQSLERQSATGEVLHIMANSPGEIQPVLESVARHAANLCQADDVQIYRVEGEHLRQTAHYGPLPALEDTEILPLDKGLVTGRAVLERRTIHIDAGNLDEIEFPISVDLQNRLKHRSVIVTPLVREEESVGAIVVRRNDVRPFTEIQIDLLKTFADQAAIAIENVRLFNETQRLLTESIQQAEELKTVNTVSRALSSELELESLIELVGSQVQKIFSADIAYVALLNKQTGFIDFPYLFGQETTPLKFGEGLTSRVIQSGEPLLMNQDEDWSETEERIGVKSKSYLGVPIFLGKEAIGVISVQSTKWTNMYGDKDVRLLSTIAGSVGIAFHNAMHLNSARPGEGGNIVSSGHNNSTGGHIFGDIEKLEV